MIGAPLVEEAFKRLCAYALKRLGFSHLAATMVASIAFADAENGNGSPRQRVIMSCVHTTFSLLPYWWGVAAHMVWNHGALFNNNSYITQRREVASTSTMAFQYCSELVNTLAPRITLGRLADVAMTAVSDHSGLPPVATEPTLASAVSAVCSGAMGLLGVSALIEPTATMEHRRPYSNEFDVHPAVLRPLPADPGSAIPAPPAPDVPINVSLKRYADRPKHPEWHTPLSSDPTPLRRQALAMADQPARVGKHVFITPALDNRCPAAGPEAVITAVCCCNMPLPPLMPGNRMVLVRTEPCTAAAGQAYAPLFRFDHKTVVYTFSDHCPNSIRICATQRMAGIPHRYRSSNAPNYERMAIEDGFQFLLRPTHVSVDGPLVPKEPVFLSDEEWLKRYPAAFRTRMLDRGAATATDPAKTYDAMTKVEKNTAADWLAFDGNQLRNKADGSGAKDCRGIFIPPEDYRLFLGPAMCYLSSWMKSRHCGRFYYSVGSSAEERGIWLDWAQNSQKLCASFNGDNFLIVKGKWVWKCDLKRCDMHHHARTHDFTVAALHHVGQHKVADDISNSLWKTIKIRHRGSVTKIRVRAGQPTGRGDTTVSNSSITYEGVLRAFARIEGGGVVDWRLVQRIIEEAFAGMGFVAEVECVDSVATPLEVEYLQERYYLTREGVRMPGNRVGRILLRTFWVRDRLSPIKNLRLMRGIALSLLGKNTHVPIINDLLFAIIKTTQGTTAHIDSDLRSRLAWAPDDKLRRLAGKRHIGAHELVGYHEHPRSVDELAEALSVAPCEIRALRAECKRVEMGLLLGSNCKPLLKKLAAWDL
jgi:hypothetical protein